MSSSLFDMDGTLVDSTVGVVGAWNAFKQTYPDLDIEHILNSISECSTNAKGYRLNTTYSCSWCSYS
jgi:beta-phosphoglucomutase-like phosphatase (HAD superfamily)